MGAMTRVTADYASPPAARTEIGTTTSHRRTGKQCSISWHECSAPAIMVPASPHTAQRKRGQGEARSTPVELAR